MRQLRLSEDRRKLKLILAELVIEGELIKTRGTCFKCLEKMNLENRHLLVPRAGYGFCLLRKKAFRHRYYLFGGRFDAMDRAQSGGARLSAR